ncbi:MAG: RHS repeat-associated core domain-containing protein, partial [Chlamydiia bacterium]|nr:RHS repeat-associated core domain-containing protein [Chlamydiia bacterium]
GECTQELLADGISFAYDYDAAGRMLRMQLHDGSAIQYEWAPVGMQSVQRIDRDGNVRYEHHYENRNLCGQVTRSRLAGVCGTLGHCHDSLHRLVDLQSEHWSEAIHYDGLGQIVGTQTTDPTGTLQGHFSYNARQQLAQESGTISRSYHVDSVNSIRSTDEGRYEIGPWNEIASSAEGTWSYDKRGNPTTLPLSGAVVHLSYDALDRLVSVTFPDGRALHFSYDYRHRRLSKRMECGGSVLYEERYLYDLNDNELGRVDEKNRIVEWRTLGIGLGSEVGSAVAIEIDEKTYVPIHDHRGNISCLLDADTGGPIASARYSAYGEMQTQGDWKGAWMFSSKRMDAELGWLYFGRRHYMPKVGRWLNPDPAEEVDGPNVYAYAGGNPLAAVDPQGLALNICLDCRVEWDDSGFRVVPVRRDTLELSHRDTLGRDEQELALERIRRSKLSSNFVVAGRR